VSGFIVVPRTLEHAVLSALIKQQTAAGFSMVLQHTTTHWQILGFAPLLTHMPDSLYQSEQGFAYCSGSFFYRNHIGREALHAAFKASQAGTFEATDANGHYALLIGDAHRCQLYRDTLPSNRIYKNKADNCFSNLLLPMCQLETTLSIDPQGLYEYAWLQANHGQRTPFREITALGANETLTIDDHDTHANIRTLPALDWAHPMQAQQQEQHIVEHYAHTLKQALAPSIEAFGSRIKTALSGGYDSRLIAAALVDDCEANYYVYGSPTSADRVVATHIANALKLNFTAIEKPTQCALSEQAYIDYIERKTVVFDGLYVDGLFDNGVDMHDRMSRLQDADILLIGSGGEALRNFFYLPDKRYTLDQLISTFYSTYDPAACTQAFDEHNFRQQLSHQLAQDVGVDPEQTLSRQQVELAYPLFRVRHWSSREIAVNQRYGWTFYPYLHPDMIKGTASIPLQWKNYGRLEGKMIQRLSPEMAAIDSDYGFSFDRPIPLKYRLKMQSTYLRPCWLRRYSYRIKMRAKPQLSWPYQSRLSHWMDPTLPQMSAYFHLEKIKDPQVFNRLATVEYLLNIHK